MHPSLNGPLLLLLVLGVPGLLCIVYLSARRRHLLRQPWMEIASGRYDRAEYGYHIVAERRGTLVQSTGYRQMDVTAIYLIDGRSFIMRGRHDMPHPHGTRIRILEHPWHGRVVEAREETD